jgi:uncharacterized protein YmfQ (DUF2313 family)
MPLPVYSSADYLAQFQRLLPRGAIWHRGVDSVQAEDLATLMPTWARLGSRLNDLIAEIFPCSTVELLGEWESSLGLPDPCTGPLPSEQQRQAAVCAKFRARGGSTPAYFVAVAAALGFSITISTFSPFCASRQHAGDPLYDEAWAFAWLVSVTDAGVVYFTASASVAGDPLATWGNELLECELEALKPAHTVIIFAYTA